MAEKGNGRTRRARLAAAVSRTKKLQRYARAIKRPGRLGKIYVAGVKPAAGYGTGVNGLDDKEWARLQTIMLAPRGPSGKGTSKRIKLALWGDPVWREASAPLLLFHKWLWRACTRPERCRVSKRHTLSLVGTGRTAARRLEAVHWAN